MFIRDGTPSGFSTMSTGVPSGQVRHVLLGHDLRDDALVAVASGHLVADRELALLGDVHLDELDHARRQLVAARDLLDLLLEFFSQRDRAPTAAPSIDAPEALVDRVVLGDRGPARRCRRGRAPRGTPSSNLRARAGDRLRRSSRCARTVHELRRRATFGDARRAASSAMRSRLLLAPRGGAARSSSSPAAWCVSSFSRRENTLMSITMPSMPGGALSDASRTSPAFSPKIAREQALLGRQIRSRPSASPCRRGCRPARRARRCG